MNIIIFLIILASLVLFHEFGHFIIAKKNGVRVDEFGLGFPPRLFSKKFGETIYSLNILPFGGFVKIFGENSESLEDEKVAPEESARSLVAKSKFVQASVLSGGVLFNVIFAWIVISIGLIFGLPMTVDEKNSDQVREAKLMISSVLPESPAEIAGLKAGDILLAIKNNSSEVNQTVTPDIVKEFISNTEGQINLTYQRGEQKNEISIIPKAGIVSDGQAIGISMDMIGTVTLPPHKAFIEGFSMTIILLKNVSVGIFHFFADAIFGNIDLASVAGPVGMVSLVGDARTLGFAYLIFFTALLSINLAVINLLPFPALDGGRLLMVLIEIIKGSPIKPKFVQMINAFGFLVLILLMLIVTYNDIIKLF